MSKRHSILPTIANFFMTIQEKLRVKFFESSCFIAGASHIKIISLHAAVFNEDAILYF